MGSQESDRSENQATEQHLAHAFNTMNVPEFVTRGRAIYQLTTGNPSTHQSGPVTQPCTELSGLSWT